MQKYHQQNLLDLIDTTEFPEQSKVKSKTVSFGQIYFEPEQPPKLKLPCEGSDFECSSPAFVVEPFNYDLISKVTQGDSVSLADELAAISLQEEPDELVTAKGNGKAEVDIISNPNTLPEPQPNQLVLMDQLREVVQLLEDDVTLKESRLRSIEAALLQQTIEKQHQLLELQIQEGEEEEMEADQQREGVLVALKPSKGAVLSTMLSCLMLWNMAVGLLS
jgi:hypothetical protein